MKLTDRDSKWRTNRHGIAILDPTGSRYTNREREEYAKQKAFDAKSDQILRDQVAFTLARHQHQTFGRKR